MPGSFSALLLGGVGADYEPLEDVYSMQAGCSGNLTLAEARGAFGDGDGEYFSSMDCKWIIAPAVANSNVRISFSMLDLVDTNDKVLIYDGGSTSAPPAV